MLFISNKKAVECQSIRQLGEQSQMPASMLFNTFKKEAEGISGLTFFQPTTR